MGKSNKPPSPKVNASGGVPVTMSCMCARKTCRGQAWQADQTSKCEWQTALGTPVVPEVKASKAMSSPVAGQAAAAVEKPADKDSTLSAALSELKSKTVCKSGCCSWASSNSADNEASHQAIEGRALVMMSPNSLARSKGMVGTAISPALTTASQASAKPMLLWPRSSTRLPVCTPACERNRCTRWLTADSASR